MTELPEGATITRLPTQRDVDDALAAIAAITRPIFEAVIDSFRAFAEALSHLDPRFRRYLCSGSSGNGRLQPLYEAQRDGWLLPAQGKPRKRPTYRGRR